MARRTAARSTAAARPTADLALIITDHVARLVAEVVVHQRRLLAEEIAALFT